MKTVYKNEAIDFSKQPMFFGEDLNISGNPKLKMKALMDMYRQMRKFHWDFENKDLAQSRIEFYTTDVPQVRHIVLSNLKYQTLLDSIQKRGPLSWLLPIVSIPELESAILVWAYFEDLHADSYRHIAESMLNDSDELYGDIILNPAIQSRVEKIVKWQDTALSYVIKWQAGIEVDTTEMRKAIYLALVSVNLLEGVLFYNSFLSNFAITEKLNILEGVTKIIKEILRDENLHLALTQTIIHQLRSGKEGAEWKAIAEDAEVKDTIYAMFDEALEAEKEWGAHLMSQGTILGLNVNIFSQHSEYRANRCLTMLGLRPRYSQKENPCNWMNKYMSDKETQGKGMETEHESYVQTTKVVGDVNNLFSF